MALSTRTIAAAGTAGSRLLAMDAHRGLIMVLMALDHASYLIARVHSQEFWGTALPEYPDAFWFWMRWSTHLCAPGFFFLLGIGMTLLAAARRSAGWCEGRIGRSFIARGLLLILLQLAVENPVWLMMDLSALPGAAVTRGGAVPGGGSEDLINGGVLFALGGSMVFWAFLRRAPAWMIALISAAAVIFTQLATPGPDRVGELYSPLVRLLLIPGHTDAFKVFYPLLPWLGVTGLGLLFGGLLLQDRRRAGRAAGWAGVAALLLFVLIRIVGGFGNLNEVPAGWMGFLNVVKYPPSLAFLAATLSINLLLLAAWPRLEALVRHPRHPLPIFGQAPLLFYLLHLWIYGIFGLFFRGGSSPATMLAGWLLGLAILYPLCVRYGRFKRGKAPASLWRIF